MNIRNWLPALMIALIIALAGCGGNEELDRDAKNIADAMCKNIDVMNKIRDANPSDSALLAGLQAEAEQVRMEMAALYKDFEQKYGEKAKTEEFSREFSKSLRKSILECPHLTKEDRERFEKEVED
jgi:hypothetical protein